MEILEFGKKLKLKNFENIDLVQTFECGQCFRWQKTLENSYIGIFKGKKLELSQLTPNTIILSTDMSDFKKIWYKYFDLETDYKKIGENITTLHPILKKAYIECSGIRILRQEPWETLCSFIISQNNNIPRIKKIIKSLCDLFGDKIENSKEKSFPSSDVISKLNLEDLEGSQINNIVLLNNKMFAASFELPEVIQKSGDGGKFSITFNQGLMDLSKMDQIVINDVMSDNLFYMLGSINVTATDEDGVVQVLTYGEDYTLETVDEDGSPDLHHLKITILYPGQYKYQITYQVTAEPGSGDEPYTNNVSVDIWGNHFEDDESGTISFSSAAEEYVLSIHKTDIDDPNRVVPGASYGIYSSQGELLAEETTDENGIAHFRGDPAAGFILASDQLYYLQETAAPEGYQLSETRYWFYYSDSDQEEINRLIETAKAVGIYRDEDGDAQAGDAQAVPNHGYTNEPIEGSSETAEPIEVTDQRIWYELPETGSTGTITYTIAGLLLTGSAVTALYREKCKKRRNK